MNFLRKSLSLGAVVASTLAFAPIANATLIYVTPGSKTGATSTTPTSVTVQGTPIVPTGTNGISTIAIPTADVGSGASFTVNAGANQVVVNPSVAYANSGQGVVQGSLSNAYAAPVLNAKGDVVTTPYFSTGGTPGTITLTFTSMQSYLGLLWGSIGTGDYITFSNSVTGVSTTITGSDAEAAATGFNGADGSRDFGGSQYTLINFLNGTTFNSVTLGQSAGPSFESANFEYAARNVAAIPEPGVIGLFGIGAAGLVASRRRKAAKV